MADIVARIREEVRDWWCGPVVAEAADEIERLRAALAPFAEAWETVTSNEAVVRSCSLGQIGHLCELEVSGVHFKNAAAALQPST